MQEATVVFLVTIIAIFGSGFSLFTLLVILLDVKMRERPSSVPVVSFLLAASIQGALAFPMYIYRKISDNHSAKGICDLYRVPYFFCGHILTMSLLCISIDRLIVIVRPFFYQKYINSNRLCLVIVFLWIMTALIDIVPFIADSDHQDDCVYHPNRDWGITVIVMYIIIPLICITISYLIIWKKAVSITMQEQKLRMQTQQLRMQTHQQQHNEREHERNAKLFSVIEMKATKTSVILITTYILCWGPLGIFYMVDNFCHNCYSSQNQLSEFRTGIKILALTSSFTTPVVYCWWNKEFRMASKHLVRKIKMIILKE